ncbi:hypothetical protein C2845_PM07G21560 [Panicum miliaceum]|uniref:F-box domain-containing protein n=1 Tax=Panicum miliaceum TaxID=4540 RepID=A0A3L6STC0_PANMI|nr:hypothetical protein C2845_PM07G21560 [Panicum miliaceum]
MAADVGRAPHRDRLSDLPDAILVTILSLLSLDEAARCSVLASRWRRLFPLTLLEFNIFYPGRRGVINLVNSILAAHPAALVRSFRTRYGSICGYKDPSNGGWLRELGRRGVQELFLSFSDRWQPIPSSLFACASLTRLRASSCTFPKPPGGAAAGAPLLTRLAEIELWDVSVPEDALHALLSHCTALERLKMRSMRKCGRVRIRSPSLKVLGTDGYFDELFVEDAPSLECLLGDNLYQGGVHLRVAHAPRLEFLGYLGMGSLAIEIGETIFTMLELFPRLETLYIRSELAPMIKEGLPESWAALGSVPCDCIDKHLRKVVFEVYRGHEWQREMAKFLHRRSRFLKAMEFHCMDDTCTSYTGRAPSQEWVREEKELLCFDSRASGDACFLFFQRHLNLNHHSICHHEWYGRLYYNNLYEVSRSEFNKLYA